MNDWEALRDRAVGETAPLEDTLAAVSRFVRRFVVFRLSAQYIGVTLWVAVTYAMDSFDVAPYLAILSAEKRSGKTRLLETLELLVLRPFAVSSTSEAALFRVLDKDHPTVLIDEVDAVFGPSTPHEGLRAILNAGYRRGKPVARLGGANKTTLELFDAFGPKALAGIGKLPDTIGDRCETIRLPRRAPGETVERFQYRDAGADAAPIRTALERWAAGSIDALRSARPPIPDALNDRAAEIWEPQLAIADMAGGDWPALARHAAVTLSGGSDASDESLGVRLLSDIRDVFTASALDRIASADLARVLAEMEEAPWGDVLHGRSIDARGLAQRLRPFDIRPRKIRRGEETAQGYMAEDFADAWTRYVPVPASSQHPERNTGTPQVDGPFRLEEGGSDAEPKTPADQHCSGVPVGNGQEVEQRRRAVALLRTELDAVEVEEGT